MKNELTNSAQRAMEGRFIDLEGNDQGDIHFHRVAWGTDAVTSAEDLGRLETEEEERATTQAEFLTKIHPKKGIRAYEGLLVMYPTSSRTSTWRQHLDELKEGRSVETAP